MEGQRDGSPGAVSSNVSGSVR